MMQGSGSMMNVSGVEGDRLLSRPAASRGFWTDDELLAVTGLGSVPLLKKVQTSRWVRPNYLAVSGGGRRRIWPKLEVVRAAILAEIVRVTSINTLGAASLLSRLGASWVDAAVQVQPRLEGVERDPLSMGTRLVLVDFREAWTEKSNGDLQLISQGMQLHGSRPEAPPVRGKQVIRRAGVVANTGVAVMTVRMSGLSLWAIELISGRDPESSAVLASRRQSERK